MTTTADKIAAECDAVRDLLLAKNKAYGDSALDPVRVFSQAEATEQLRVRIDDKLSRIMRGQAAGEDTITDLWSSAAGRWELPMVQPTPPLLFPEISQRSTWKAELW